MDFNKYADCNEQAGREDTCYERKGSLCRDKRNCTKTRCLGCGSVCEVCCDVCPNRANVAIKVPGLAKHQVVHVDGMCNECGNCAVFCPYQEGRPYKDKLTLFWSEEDMENSENEASWPWTRITLRSASPARSAPSRSMPSTPAFPRLSA